MTESALDTLTHRLDRLEEIRPSQKARPIGHRRDRKMKKISSISGIAALVVFLVLVPMTYGQSSPPGADVTGTWQGQWTAGRFSGDVSLKLTQQGSAVTGTISMERTLRFGAGEKPIRNGQVSGGAFSFTADGENITLDARLNIHDGRMSGEAAPVGWNVRFDLKKVQ